ncbi:MAG: GDP-mannose 4,6-dehydratase [Bacteroidia bacterium]|nr:GDP-mannose 4,6-dehydratase [Bacteroidia bacterium]
MNAIIFGINSQDGIYLKEILESKNIVVKGVSRSVGEWIVGDIGDYEFVSELIKNEKPSYIFHLAANSTTRHNVLFENHKTISSGTLNVLESVKLYSPITKVFITGSGVQFKNVGVPIKETDEFEGNSPYSVARIHSVYAARYYRSLGIQTYIGYLFHHESPYRKHHHISKLTTDFIKSIGTKTTEKLELGDINVKKEWAYAKDIAEAIYTLVNQDVVWESTIGTGEIYSIKEWLINCFEIKGLNWENYVVTKNSDFKPEYNILQSNPSTIKSLGWKPMTSFYELAKIMME